MLQASEIEATQYNISIMYYSDFQLDREVFEGSDAIWQILDMEGKGSISKEDIMKLEEPILTSLATTLNLPNTLKGKSKDEL